MSIELKMFFLTFSNINVLFIKQELTWRFYTTTKLLPITKQIELIPRKRFAKRHEMRNQKRF